jgi:hypothetical protein
MAEPSTGPSQIVGRQLRHSDASGGFLHNVPNGLYRHLISPCLSHFVDPAEQSSSINCGCGEPIFQFGSHPIRNWNRPNVAFLFQPGQQWPNALRAAGDDALSRPRFHASSTHTQVAMQARLGHAFLSAADDRVLAKAHCLALPSTSCRGECPTSSPL